MAHFSFRFRFLRSPVDTLNIEASQWELRTGALTPPLILRSRAEKPIKESTELVFLSDGWASAAAAEFAARKYGDALKWSLARLRVGADFGHRGPKGVITNAGLAMLNAQTGHRHLNDEHGPLIYESEPSPRFASAHIKRLRGVSQRHFERILSEAVKHSRQVADRERVSLDLFNASFFQNSWDSRFLMLVMAVEALLDPLRRGPEALQHVEALLQQTRESSLLSKPEKQSLLGSLKWLLCESINQAGRRLAQDQLGARVYAGKDAAAFFSHCYDLRSRMVHGKDPFPAQEEINSVSGDLEVFVSDLLSGELLKYRTVVTD